MQEKNKNMEAELSTLRQTVAGHRQEKEKLELNLENARQLLRERSLRDERSEMGELGAENRRLLTIIQDVDADRFVESLNQHKYKKLLLK